MAYSSFTTYEFEFMYDVFISFRGADTRLGFTGHLHRALRSNNIRSFMDDQDLAKGAEINPALEKAIQNSLIALVILSKNYASSSFCLDELVKIMVCSKDKGMLVLPVFYRVDPCVVRHLKGTYANAFKKHKSRVHMDKIQDWSLALTQVAALSGWHFNGCKFEYEVIDSIVDYILKRIQQDKCTTQHDKVPSHVMLGIPKQEEAPASTPQRALSATHYRDNEGTNMRSNFEFSTFGWVLLHACCAVLLAAVRSSVGRVGDFNLGLRSNNDLVPAEIFPAGSQSTCQGIWFEAFQLGVIVVAIGLLYLAMNKVKKSKADAGYSTCIIVKTSLIVLGVAVWLIF